MNDEPTPVSDESNPASPRSHALADDVQYMFMTVRAIRGREGAAKTKWQNQGWEFVDETRGTLRSQLNFRKAKPKGMGAYVAQVYTAFRGLPPRTQRAVFGGVASIVGVLIIGITVVAVAGGDEAPGTKQATANAKSSGVPDPTLEPTTEPASPETAAVTRYSYEGPSYEIITIDESQTPAKLTQYWVLTSEKFDFSSAAYKNQVKAIIADIAHEQGTVDFLAEVVTKRKIADAESPSTYQDFINKHGTHYALKTIPRLERTGWVASYTGGFDRDAGVPSQEALAYEVVWRPYASAEIEKWKP